MKFKCFILSIFFCALCYNDVFSQSNEIDSILSVIKNAKEDTNKVNTLNALSNKYHIIGIDQKAIEFGKEALSLAEKIGFKKGSIRAYLKTGEAYLTQGNYAEALKNSYACLKLSEEIADKRLIAYSLQFIGGAYDYQGNYTEALKNLLASLKIREEIGDSSGIAQSYNAVAGEYSRQENYTEALKKHEAALKIYKGLGDKGPYWGLPWSYSLIGNTHKRMGEIAYEAGDKSTATKEFEEALNNFFDCLKSWQKAGDIQGTTEAYNWIGSINTDLKKYSEAKTYLDKSLRLAKSINYKGFFSNIYYNLMLLDSIQGDYRQAYDHYKIYILYRDSVFNEENARKSLEAQMKYEFGKKEDSLNQKQILTETKLQVQKKQKYFYWGGLVLLALLSFFVFANFRNQKKINRLAAEAHARQKAELELQSQQTVLNERLRISSELHDEVGATLSGIAMYSHLTKEQMKTGQTTEIEKSLNVMQQSSAQMVDKLNDIVWLINPEQDPLQKLIERLEEYATNMAAIKNIHVKVNIPGTIAAIDLPVEIRRNIYLFCKEAINNAVKYSNATVLELTVKEADGKLEFSVSDNGKGFDAVMVRRGNGLENMQKRADEIGAKLLLQSKENEGASVSLQCKIT